MSYATVHDVLVLLYAALPVLALIGALVWGRWRKTAVPLASFLVTCLSGVILGTCVDLIYVALLHGRVAAGEVLRTWYFLTAILCGVGIFRWVVRYLVFGALRIRPNMKMTFWSRLRLSLASLVQLVIIFGLGLPYVVGTMLVYRVHTTRGATPQSIAHCEADAVSFPSTDDLTIRGWWVPAAPVRPAMVAAKGQAFGTRTVLLCGGLSDDLVDEAGFLRVLVNDGYNVLVINTRGHDGSDGRWISFGDLERRDVLGAVRWVQENHPDDAEQIKALGVGVGGAAVIAAAADPSDEGQAIDSVAVIGSYANFPELAGQLFTSYLPPHWRHFAVSLTLPIASANVGTNLSEFSPGKLTHDLWPRPILIVAARGDRIFPPTESEELTRRASYPKRSAWVPGGHDEMLHSREAAAELLDFFDHVKPSPAI